MAGHGDQWSLQPIGHVPHEAGLPAARWALQHDRHAVVCGCFKQRNFSADLRVIGLLLNAVPVGLQLLPFSR